MSDLVNDRSNGKSGHRVVPSTLVRDEIEFPGYMLESEETKRDENSGVGWEA
ncbi:hypothetical protein [Burkholderia sp. Bp9012]|uniref:hypothetical protein n=1 Tax=Burkholderia sp. Bp9012 TaxID=2184562 RepID=UPI0021AB2033|nr:hypothetical protein [Burkholderia sp. Bp9012]